MFIEVSKSKGNAVVCLTVFLLNMEFQVIVSHQLGPGGTPYRAAHKQGLHISRSKGRKLTGDPHKLGGDFSQSDFFIILKGLGRTEERRVGKEWVSTCRS